MSTHASVTKWRISLGEGVLGLVDIPTKPKLLHEGRPGISESLGRHLLKERAQFDGAL